jgi:antirestriction protein ArdC
MCCSSPQQRPTASHVCGFKAWLSFGRHVRKGEKGIQILAPIVGKKKADDAAAEDERNTKTMVYGFRTVFVCGLEQTDGEDLPAAPSVQGDAAGHLNTLLEFIRQQGIIVEFSEQIAPALGLSCGGKILLAPGHSEADTLATLVHEYAHESMHKAGRRTSTTKTIRETEAEAVAFAVCSGLGLDCGSSSSDYIGLYDGNADTLIASLEIVQKTACQILDTLAAATRSEQG